MPTGQTPLTPAQSQRLAHALAGSRLALWDWNMQTGETVFNERWAEIVGYSLAELEPVSIDTWAGLAHPDDLAASNAAIEAHARGETPFYDVMARMRHRDGHWVWVHDRGRIVEWDAEGRPLRMAGTHEDVTDRMEVEESRLALVKRTDALTGLPNRVGLIQELDAQVQARRVDHLVLFLVDVDRFAAVNDSYGHDAGDAVLHAVADRLRARGGYVARVSSDEFAVVREDLADSERALREAAAIVDALAAPFRFPDGSEVFLSACVGFALCDPEARDPGRLMQWADSALKDAQRSGPGSIRQHIDELLIRARDRVEIESRLRQGWAAREFALVYQPQVDVRTGAIVGVEALMRWRPATGEAPPPSVFIPVAEEIGLIGEMGDWVLREAVRQLRIWQDGGLPSFTMAVNVSARQLALGELPAAIITAVKEFDIDPSRIELEITESALLAEGEASLALFEDLRATGVRLAVDDFGTGYSSFGYISRFRMQTLKIDRVFVDALSRGPADQAISSAIIALGHALEMTVLAEGVETVEQRAILQAQGCDHLQGFLVSPPLEPGALAEFVARSATTPR